MRPGRAGLRLSDDRRELRLRHRDGNRAIHAFEPLDIFWYEEPLQWFNSIRGLGRLATRTRVPIASGESELTPGPAAT